MECSPYLIACGLSSILHTATNVVNAVEDIATQYFDNGPIFLLISSQDDSAVSLTLLQRFATRKRWLVILYNDILELPPEKDRPKQKKQEHVIVVLDSTSDWSYFILLLRSIRILGDVSKLLIISSHPNYEEILQESLKIHIVNATVLSYTSGNIKLHTIYPYALPEPRLEVLDNNGISFPQKTPRNFVGYTIDVILNVMEPYVLPDLKDGVEIRLIKTIAKFYSLGINFKKPPPGEIPRLAFLKGKANGIVGALYRHEADIALGGFLRNAERHEICEALIMHTEDYLRWAYPRPKSIVDWRSLYRSFSADTWLLIALVIILSAITATFIGKLTSDHLVFQTFSSNIFSFGGIIVERATSIEPTGQILRGFFMTALMYALIVNSSYKSCLVTLLTTPTQSKGYQDVMQALSDGLILILQYKPRSDASKKKEWEVNLKEDQFIISYNTTDNMQRIAVNRSAIFLATEFPCEYVQNKYFLDKNGEPMVTYMKERYNTFSTVLLMAPGHPMERMFNKKIEQLVEGGIVDQWREMIMVTVKVQSKVVPIGVEDEGSKALTLANLYPIFILLALNLLACGLVLLGEIVRFKWNLRLLKISKVDIRPTRKDKEIMFGEKI